MPAICAPLICASYKNNSNDNSNILADLLVEQLINFDRSVMTYKMMNKICPESL